MHGFLPSPQQISNHHISNTVNFALLSLLVLWCVPDLIGELLLIAMSDAQLPVKKRKEDQQDEDEEQRAHNGADYHTYSVWSCEIRMNNKDLLSQTLCCTNTVKNSYRNLHLYIPIFWLVTLNSFFFPHSLWLNCQLKKKHFSKQNNCQNN